MNFGLENRVVVVTGAGQGMGRAYAHAFAKEGATVCLIDINEQSLSTVGQEIETLGLLAELFCADVCSEESMSKTANAVIAKHGRVDVLVNNAAIRLLAMLEETTADVWDRQMNINLRGVFHTCKAVIPQMKKQRYGKIVNVSSLAGKRGHALRGAAYAASKGGVIALTKSIAREVASYDINVNAIAPSVINTGFLADFSEQEMQRLQSQIPLGRVGEPTDLVGIVLLLSSDAGSFIDGQIINVDGGQFMA